MALAVVLPAAQLVSPACCERPSTLYPQLFTVVLVALHWLADMEGNANRYDTNEVSDDEEEIHASRYILQRFTGCHQKRGAQSSIYSSLHNT